MAKNLNSLIKELENAGYKVKKAIPTTKKTFEVEIETVNKFMIEVKKRNLKVKDAINDALENWINKKS